VLALRLLALFRHPLKVAGHAAFNTARSTLFLSALCAIYQSTCCASRNLFPSDHKFLYWFAGITASASVLIEQKSRRSELALYVAPLAADALYLLMRDHRWLGSMPYGEVLLFCLSTGGLMHFFTQHNGRSMSPVVNSIFQWLFRKHKVLG